LKGQSLTFQLVHALLQNFPFPSLVHQQGLNPTEPLSDRVILLLQSFQAAINLVEVSQDIPELLLDGVEPRLEALLHCHKPLVEAYEPLVEAYESLVEVCKPLVEVCESLVEVCESLVEVCESLVEAYEPLVDIRESLVEACEPLVEACEPLVDGCESLLDLGELAPEELDELLVFVVGHLDCPVLACCSSLVTRFLLPFKCL